jgi:tetratricopeptide (TPR) repeat protein
MRILHFTLLLFLISPGKGRNGALFLISIALLSSCHLKNDQETLTLQKNIDSLNKLYNKPSVNIPADLAGVGQVLNVSDSIHYTRGFVDASINGYRIYFQDKNYPEAIRNLENARKKLTGRDLPALEARVEFFMGLYHSYIKNYDIAYNFFIQSAGKYKQLKDTMRLAKTYTELGQMYIRTQNWPLARKYLRLAYVTNNQLIINPNPANDLDLLGVYFQRTGINDSAEYYYEKAYQINENLRNLKVLAQNLVNFGGFYVDVGKFSRAEELLLRALRITDSIPDKDFTRSITPFIYTNLGVLYNRMKQYSSAKINLEEAMVHAGPEVDIVTRSNIYYEYYLCCKELKFHDEAYSANDRYIALIDSNAKKNIKEDLMSLEMKYNYAEQHKEQLARQQRMKLFMWGLGIIAVFIIALLILLYRQQRIKVLNAKLEKKIVDDKLELRDRELASHMLNMVRVNERKLSLIRTLKEQLPMVNKENQQVVAKVIEGMDIDQDDRLWKEFEIRFTEVHQEFYTKLARLNPNLTPNEKRLCAFLLLDMTTKDISYITGQSLKTLEQARYRLRKQLGISNPNVNLSGFLASL